MLPLLANVSTITPTLEAGPESDSGPLVIQHMGGWLRKWEQGATSKKALSPCRKSPRMLCRGHAISRAKMGSKIFWGYIWGYEAFCCTIQISIFSML